MKYTEMEYKNLLQEYCTEKGYPQSVAEKYLLKEYIYQKDLLNDNEDTNIIQMLSDLIVKEMCCKSNNYKYLLDRRRYLVGFYEWAKKKGLINWNPFESNLLQPKILLHKRIADLDLVVFDDKDIELLCEKIVINKPLYEMLIRIFYERVETIQQFLSLTMSDINFEKKMIKINDNWKHFSKQTFNSIEEYIQMKSFTVIPSHKGMYELEMKEFENRLYKVIIKRKNQEITLDEYKKMNNRYISNKFKDISSIAGYRIIPENLFKSGFISYVYKRCGEDKTKFLDLFVGVENTRSNSMVTKILEEYAKEYGIIKKGKEIRKTFAIYALKSKYVN